MKNDFLSIYTTIDNKEQEAFSNYLNCFYSTQKKRIEFYGKVVDLLRADKSDEKDLDKIRKATLKEKKDFNAFSELKQWLLEFLTIQELRYSSTEAKFLSLEALRRYKLLEVYQQKSDELLSEWDEKQDSGLWHLFWKFRLTHAKFFSIPLDRLQDYQEDLLQIMQNLDDFYIAAKLQCSAELFNRTKILQDKYDIILLEEVLDTLNSNRIKNPLLHQLYKPLQELYTDHSEEAYLKLKEFLYSNPKHDIFERHDILLHLINYNARKLHTDDRTDLLALETFKLYQFGIQESLFTVAGYFQSNTFLNILNTACHLREYDWINDFLGHYEPLLPPDERIATIQIAKARVYFEERKYDEVIDALLSYKYTNIGFDLNIRLIQLRAYYERGNKNELPKMKSANHNLYISIYRNKKMSEAIRQKVFNFCKMYKILLVKNDKKQLLKELNKRKPIACLDWVKMKIDEKS